MSSAMDTDDIVYQTMFIDNASMPRDLMLSLTLHFNDVLDGDKLHGALCRLL